MGVKRMDKDREVGELECVKAIIYHDCYEFGESLENMC
jgi:hypothetical protein